MQRDDKETPREEFIKLVKEKGKVWASLSHEQSHPRHISNFAILQWQWDELTNELFAITSSGKRAVASKTMPAFHVYGELV